MYNGVYTIEQYAYIHDTLVKWLDLKLHGESIGARLKDRGVGRAAIYGMNEFGWMVYEDVRRDVSVEAFIDRRADDIDTTDGIEVLHPDEAAMLPAGCFVLVTPEYYFREIYEYLTGHGVRGDRILSMAMAVA